MRFCDVLRVVLLFFIFGFFVACNDNNEREEVRDKALIYSSIMNLKSAFNHSNIYYVNHGSFSLISDMTEVEFDSNEDASKKDVSVNYTLLGDKKPCVNFSYSPKGVLKISALSRDLSINCKEVISSDGFKSIEGEYNFSE